MRAEPTKKTTGIRSMQAAGKLVDRVLALVDKLDAPVTCTEIVLHGGGLARQSSAGSLGSECLDSSLDNSSTAGLDSLFALLDEAAGPRKK